MTEKDFMISIKWANKSILDAYERTESQMSDVMTIVELMKFSELASDPNQPLRLES